MVCQYEDICRKHGCRAKVFVKEHGALKKKMGCPDLLILFTNTVSHKMVLSASGRQNGITFRLPVFIRAALQPFITCFADIAEGGGAPMETERLLICYCAPASAMFKTAGLLALV